MSASQILGGAVVASGELEARVTAIGTDTFFGKTIALLGAPEEVGHLQKVRPRPCWSVTLSAGLLGVCLSLPHGTDRHNPIAGHP
jgi:magnesium-transporting ATPase (P-type)